MSLLKVIEDKGAVVEWSPCMKHPNLVALGTKDSAGSGFDDYGGELELHSLNFSDAKSKSSSLLGKARANSRFSSIAWSQMASRSADYPCGLIAGGMIDGSIHIWNPEKIISEDSADALISSIDQHTGAIYGLQFNPHKESSHLLASGGVDCEVYVMALDRPDQPNVFIPAPPPNNAKHTADISKVAWNTQVAHILASSSLSGSSIIWDLRQKKAWCELKEPSGGSVSDIAWHPDQGLHVVTAGGDDKNPVIKLWDLRSSTSLPLATLQGHTEGILSVSWCPSDPSLLLSCGKDNKTLLWDLFHLQSVYELPSVDLKKESDASSDSQMFGGYATSASNRRYDVQWSPCVPAVISSCSFDRSVQFHSMTGARNRTGRAPRWLRRPVGAVFGFGGKLVTFTNKPIAAADKKKGGATCSAEVTILQVIENAAVTDACETFHEALAKEDFNSFCAMKASTATTDREKQVWGLMKVICFEKNAREELLAHLGFDADTIAQVAHEYITTPQETNIANAGLMMNTDEMVAAAVKAEEAEPMIRKALVVGNFAAAVDCCLEAGLMAEALLLAQCGEPSLWAKTQEVFFQRRRANRPFLDILHAVIKNDFTTLVVNSDLSKWKETLSLISTFGKAEEFPVLCETLANRLENEIQDIASATLCYMCANNVPRTVGFWTEELKEANARAGALNTVELQHYVEKVVIYTQANPCDDLGEECAHFFSQYASLLASQGKLDYAAKYLRGSTLEESILRDRLYHASPFKAPGERPPVFPFQKIVVNTVLPQQENMQINRTRTESNDASAIFNKGATGVMSPQSANPHAAASTTLKTSHSVGASSPNPYNQQNTYAQQSQQQAAMNNVSNKPGPIDVAPAAPSNALPAGWIQLIDPNSGRPYYCNQTMGVTQWEPPAPEPAVTAPMNPHRSPAHNPAVLRSASEESHQLAFPGATAHAAASMPHAASPAAARPASPAKPKPAPEPAKPAMSNTVSQPAVTAAPVQLSSSTLANLNSLISALQEKSLSPGDKKQLQMVSQCFQFLVQKFNTNDIDEEVQSKLETLVGAVHNRNFPIATNVQMDLANTVWLQHKEWIKGMKILIQLSTKY